MTHPTPRGEWLHKPAMRHVKGKLHVVTEAGRYRAANGTEYELWVGLETDGGSVPRPLWWWLPPFGDDAECAYLLHDMLYRYAEAFPGDDHGHMSRGTADALLREAAEAAGYPGRRAIIVRGGLWCGGWLSWRRYRNAAKVAKPAAV